MDMGIQNFMFRTLILGLSKGDKHDFRIIRIYPKLHWDTLMRYRFAT